MKSIRALFTTKYGPLFKMLIQTLLLFLLILLPLSINVTSLPPPYSITNSEPAGLSYFNEILLEEGYNTTRTLLSTEPILDLPESSILIITGGTKNYQSSELATINAFVASGGILILIAGDRPTNKLAEYFGIYVSGSIVMETEYYFKSPEILLLNSPFSLNGTMCLVQSNAITAVQESDDQRELYSMSTEDTAFLDSNGDGIWDTIRERTRSLKIGTAVQRGGGVIVTISSASFLSNELYAKGFSNINVVMYILNSYTEETSKLVCFEESHKRWPFASTDGIINQSYGSIILLSKTNLFIVTMVILILVFFYFTPRFKELFKTKESYKKFISDRIWSRKRELYDTFGTPIKPTIEEKYLSTLYFQYELYPNQAYNYYLIEKLNYIPMNLLKEEEKKLFEIAVEKKLDGETFLSLFQKLEEIQKRGKYE